MRATNRPFDISLPDHIDTAPVPKQALARHAASARISPPATPPAKPRAKPKAQPQPDPAAYSIERDMLTAQGKLVLAIPLDQISTDLHLPDRALAAEEELAELMASIQQIGLFNPIRVVENPGGGYTLVQGARRLHAYRALLEQTGQGAWALIPALIVPGDGARADLYRAMVDENAIRKTLSFAEMAEAARRYLNDPQTEAASLSDAVALLFKSAAYSKRSAIRSFARLLEALGDALRFPAAIPRALGLALVKALNAAPDAALRMRATLRADAPKTAEEELALLRECLDEAGPVRPVPEAPVVSIDHSEPAPVPEPAPEPEPEDPDPKPEPPKPSRPKARPIQLQTRSGPARYTAAPGRLMLRMDHDFTTLAQDHLSRALTALIDTLGFPGAGAGTGVGHRAPFPADKKTSHHVT